MVTVESRVTDLELLMADVLHAQANSAHNLDRLSDHLERLSFELGDFKTEMRGSQKRINKQWGELSRKMGTLAEDLVAPSIPRILREVVNCPSKSPQTMAVRVRRYHQYDYEWRQEFDVVATCGNYLLINETKSTLRAEDIPAFIDLLQVTRDFFPEHADKQVIGAIASLYVDASVARHAERNGLIVLGFGEELMSVLNSPNFTPHRF